MAFEQFGHEMTIYGQKKYGEHSSVKPFNKLKDTNKLFIAENDIYSQKCKRTIVHTS